MSISRRNFLKLAGLGISASLLPALWRNSVAATDPAVGKRPNFLVFLADDMGFSDAGCYGGEIHTPNIDKLAAAGLRFTSFYNTGRCWPSRASLLTGYYPQQIRGDTLPNLLPNKRGRVIGIKGTRPEWAPLLPKMLKPLGYRSYHAGKWHISGEPMNNGFDGSFLYEDTDHHFLPKQLLTETNQPRQETNSEGYYSSTAIADNVIRQLKEHARQYPDKPFFELVAFTEPHFPVQAPREDIDRYRDSYLKGWDALRLERLKRMKEMGIVNCDLSPLDPDVIPAWNATPEELRNEIGPGEVPNAVAWNTLTEEQKKFQAIKMAIHAAMVDRMDREIGRVLEQLKAMNALDNTVIMFVSDNGASAEQMIRGGGHDKSAPPGSAKSFLCLGPGFSSAANTPFRLHKCWVHEGGISTPFIVHWPAGIKARGELRHGVTHLVDISATLIELAGGKAPNSAASASAPARPGISLVPAFEKDGAVQHDYLWWYHEHNKAIRSGDWKLVSKGDTAPWELYDMKMDRCESEDLADKYPEKVKELSAKWEEHAKQFCELALADEKDTGSNAKPIESRDDKD